MAYLPIYSKQTMIMQPKVHASKIKQQIYIPQVNCSVGHLVINTNLLLWTLRLDIV